MKLNNKEKCRFRSLLTKKLETMGIKDEITYVESAKKRMFVFNAKTNQFESKIVSRYRAQNLLRNMVKKLTAGDKTTVLAFLSLDPTKFQAPKPAQGAIDGS